MSEDRFDTDRDYAIARLAVVRERLACFCSANAENAPSEAAAVERLASLERAARETASAMEVQPALDRLSEGLGLTVFESEVVLLCAGVEIDSQIPLLCATAHGNGQMIWPTFSLAFSVLANAEWEALTPDAPLRRWRLIEIDRGNSLLTSPLRIDERILHFILGEEYLDERLDHFFHIQSIGSTLPASYRNQLEQIGALWGNKDEGWPVIYLTGDARKSTRSLAAASCAALGMRLHVLRTADIPAQPVERETLARLWQREALLLHSALLIESEDADDVSILRNSRSFLKRISSPLMITGAGFAGNADAGVARIEIGKPTLEEQRALWELSLGDAGKCLNGQLDQIVSQFQFDVETIHSTGNLVRNLAATSPNRDVPKTLWETCRSRSRASLRGLAETIDTKARWEDLVLPPEQLETLHEIAAQVRQRMKVYESWGFGARTSRGLGISALFSGPSGTGKTLAAEVLAHHLQLDLYRIDLSQVVSKYIGETEKNLRAVFDGAEKSGAVLLFDEADALFGKRSEVRDSHDRYANIEVSYLLQRMESYRGLAILTTNLRGSLDGAFLRRIRFIVSFPFPDIELRIRIWSNIFPADTPTQDLDFAKLARLNVTGGNIRNIALNAAFLAADLGQPVKMNHLLRTARSECLKIEKPTTAAELGGWL